MTKKTKNTPNVGKKMPKTKEVKRMTKTPKKTIADRLLHFARAADEPDLKARYEAVLGIGRPVEDFLASYSDLLKEGAKIARAGLANAMVQKGADLKLQVSRIAIRPFDKLDFPVEEARKVGAAYGKAGYDGFAGVRISPVPDSGSGADMMAMDLVSFYWGNATPRAPVRRRSKVAVVDWVERSSVSTFALSDKATVRAALAAIFSPPLSRTPAGDLLDDEDQHFAQGSKQAERALMALMCRSQLPAKKMLFGFGAGKSVIDGVHGRLKYLADQKRKGTPEVVHRDLVPHFWFEELRRLELDHLSVPTIRLR